jgi:group I intron endonuclease
MITLYEYNTLPKLPGIYKFHDIETGRFYIGSSMNLRKRIGNHFYSFNRNIHKNPILQALWNKDPMRFRCEILILLDEVSKETLLKFEQIQLDNSNVGKNELCMNVLHIAGSHYGRKRSPETVAKLREINRGRSPSAEAREKMRQAKLGTKQSKETIEKRTKHSKGEKNNFAKLKEHEAYEVKYSKIPLKQLAEKYKMSISGLEKIRYGKSWQSI